MMTFSLPAGRAMVAQPFNGPKGPPRAPEEPSREEPFAPEPPGPPEQDIRRH
jgi:hypothetical protein